MKRMAIFVSAINGFVMSVLMSGYAGAEESCPSVASANYATVSEIVAVYRLNVEPFLTNDILQQRDITLEFVDSNALKEVLEEQLKAGNVIDESRALTKSYLNEDFLNGAHITKLSSPNLRSVFYVTERDVPTRTLVDAFVVIDSETPKPVGWHTIGDQGTAITCNCVAIFTTPIKCTTCTDEDSIGFDSLKDQLEERFTMTTQPIRDFTGKEVISTQLPDITIERLKRKPY